MIIFVVIGQEISVFMDISSMKAISNLVIIIEYGWNMNIFDSDKWVKS